MKSASFLSPIGREDWWAWFHGSGESALGLSTNFTEAGPKVTEPISGIGFSTVVSASRVWSEAWGVSVARYQDTGRNTVLLCLVAKTSPVFQAFYKDSRWWPLLHFMVDSSMTCQCALCPKICFFFIFGHYTLHLHTILAFLTIAQAGWDGWMEVYLLVQLTYWIAMT